MLWRMVKALILRPVSCLALLVLGSVLAVLLIIIQVGWF